MKTMMKLICVCCLFFAMGAQAEISKEKCGQLNGEWKNGKCSIIEKESCKSSATSSVGYWNTVKKSCLSFSESGVKSQGTDCTGINGNTHEASQDGKAGVAGGAQKSTNQ